MDIARNVALGGLAAIAAAGILLSVSLTGSRVTESQATGTGPTAAASGSVPTSARSASISAPSGTATSGVGSTPDPVPVNRIVHLLRAEAAQFGDPHPTAMRYVRVRRGSVIPYISGATLDPRTKDIPVVMAQTRGRFAELTRGIAGPHSDAVLRGSAIDLIIDLQTGNVLDIGIDQAPADLSTLGPVVRLSH